MLEQKELQEIGAIAKAAVKIQMLFSASVAADMALAAKRLSGTMSSDAIAKSMEIQLLGTNDETDEFIPLAERLNEFVEEPDKAADFTFVGNDTWLPKHLVNARRHQQRKMSRRAKTGIVWTR
jgi:hypothetical protein